MNTVSAPAEIREDEAQGEIAAIYADLRATLRIPIVNLIWRHLAAIPEPAPSALAWAWPVVRSAQGRIAAAIPALRAEADCLTASLALPLPDAPKGARAVVDAYDGGNSANMLNMALLASVRAGAAPPPPEDAGPADETPGRAPIPPIPRYDALDPDLRACIGRLSSAGPGARAGVRPSLWSHLALWPDLLRAITDPACTLLASPAFRDAYSHFAGRGPALLGINGPPPSLDAPPDEAAVDTAIRRFRVMIPEMTLIGRVLLRGLSD